MNGFVCAARLSGGPASDPLRPTVHSAAPGFSVLDVGHGAAIARRGTATAVGTVRLDNRPDLLRRIVASATCTDLDIVLAIVLQSGVAGIADLLGDFAFVMWNPVARELLAARDAFGVKPLYVRSRPDLLTFASAAATLADSDAYESEYIAEFLVNSYDPTPRTPYAGVRAVAPGTVLRGHAGRIATKRYWSAAAFEPAESADPGAPDADAACETFRTLFEQSVALRLAARGGGGVWSQLSGGLDSSSVVSMAQSLERAGAVPNGLGGAVSLVDRLDDEGEYARDVARSAGVRHEMIEDYWLWQDDGAPPPLSDAPDGLYPFYARNRRMRDVVRTNGGTVLLSGLGPDHYLAGNILFIADWVAAGQLPRAARELYRWAMASKSPFWKFAYDWTVLPLVPVSVRRRLAPRASRPPAWIQPAFARRFDLTARSAWYRGLDAPRGAQYAGQIAFVMDHVPACVDRGLFEDGIEMRFPFLYRPLVEFSLRLPRELRTRPTGRKWIMREALRGVLPESVRTRRGKGGISRRVRWSLGRERGLIDELLRDPMLAQLGVVDPAALRRTLADAERGDDLVLFPAVRALALETWLRVRAGGWSTRASVSA